MTPSARAVIDIGTNSVKLLVAEVNERAVRPIVDLREQTRLGRGFYETHRLHPDAIAATAEAVRRFASVAADHGAPCRLIATSAARDAVNGRDLTEAVRQLTGMDTTVISGEMEAELVFRGVSTHPSLRESPLFILDVGGGSTEFILGRMGHAHFSRSYQQGSVRLLEILHPADPPTREDWERCHDHLLRFLRQRVRPELESFLANTASEAPQLIGTGGTGTLLARIELGRDDATRQDLDHFELSFEQVRSHCRRLWSLPSAERRRVPGLPANRADVILTGAAIHQAIMEEFSFDRIRISLRGLCYGALLSRSHSDG